MFLEQLKYNTRLNYRLKKDNMSLKLEQLYKNYSKYVFNIALGIIRNKTQAEDITHDVFVKLYYALDSFRGESDIKTFIYRMTVNKSIDLIRSNKLHNNKIEKIQIKENNTFLKSDLYNLLNILDLNYRLPLLLSEIGGFTYKEIAQILNINIGTVKSRINRAINKLRKEIKGDKNEM
jgi:RNA polymerase sigma-70 factor (ECF subfamily)